VGARRVLVILSLVECGRGTLLKQTYTAQEAQHSSSYSFLSVHTDKAKSTQLVILIKNIYPLGCRKRFFLPVTYFPAKSNEYNYGVLL